MHLCEKIVWFKYDLTPTIMLWKLIKILENIISRTKKYIEYVSNK